MATGERLDAVWMEGLLPKKSAEKRDAWLQVLLDNEFETTHELADADTDTWRSLGLPLAVSARLRRAVAPVPPTVPASLARPTPSCEQEDSQLERDPARRAAETLRLLSEPAPGWPQRYAGAAKIGRGGSASVFRATRREDGAVVAVKVVRAQFSGALAVGTSRRRRLEREAKALASVQHRNVVAYSGHCSFAPDDSFFLLEMEYAGGRSLQLLLEQSPGSALSPGLACHIMVRAVAFDPPPPSSRSTREPLPPRARARTRIRSPARCVHARTRAHKSDRCARTQELAVRCYRPIAWRDCTRCTRCSSCTAT